MSSMNSIRYTQLDALRGLAALSVVLGHFIGLLPVAPSLIHHIENTPLHIFWDGAAAVDLFFVLSGFCIAVPYVRDNDRRAMIYDGFLIRRFFRLYPAYIITIILCFVLKHFYTSPGSEYISSWGESFWQWDDLTIMQLVNVISLIGRFDPNLLDPPTWSLVVEMRMAFLLPLLIIVANKFERYNFCIFAILLILSFIKTLAGIFNFGYLFYLGIILARNLPKICAYVNAQSKKCIFGILFIGALLYESRFPFRMIFVGADGYTYTYENVFHILTGLGSAVIICMFFYKSIQHGLSHRLGSFLGYISYSVYLIHFPILLGLCQSKINLWYIFPGFMLLSILGAYSMYKFIELPGIKLGRYLSDKH